LDAFTLSIEQILAIADDAARQGACELHIVGGINPDLPYSYYVEMIRRLHERHPQITLKAFTAPELDHLSQISGKGITDVLSELKSAGLACLPGGGAEVFNDRVRTLCFPQKISARRWLDIHRTAHKLGIRSTATMLFGHAETAADRVDHLLTLRDLQDETGGFLAMVPLPFKPPASAASQWPAGRQLAEGGGIDILRTTALCRLLLDNIAHIKAFWPIYELKTAELALHYGADDLNGTVGPYHIVATQQTPAGLAPDKLRKIILNAGFMPILRNSFYQDGK